jgi:uncharacterized protein (DUF697 family)
VQAEIVAHLQREFDGALKDLRAELGAEIVLRCAAVASELTLRTAEIEVVALVLRTVGAAQRLGFGIICRALGLA